MRIAFATSPQLPDGFADDREAAALLGAEFVVWSDPNADWDSFDHVVIRSTWDYTSRRDDFVAWARGLTGRISNSADLIAFNSDKSYLAVLGIPTVPTTYVVPGGTMPELVGEVVIKPTISAGADDTGRFDPDHHAQAAELAARILATGRAVMVQPYVDGVDTAGETAIVFIDGEYSHVLHKKPVLREQGESGDLPHDLVTLGTADEAQLDLAHDVVGRVAGRFGMPLYVRVDLVPGPAGPLVIEVEAVEPCLHFDLAPGSAGRLADAVRRRLA